MTFIDGIEVLFEAIELNTIFLAMELVTDVIYVVANENVIDVGVEGIISVLNVALYVEGLSFVDEARTVGVVDVFSTASVI